MAAWSYKFRPGQHVLAMDGKELVPDGTLLRVTQICDRTDYARTGYGNPAVDVLYAGVAGIGQPEVWLPEGVLKPATPPAPMIRRGDCDACRTSGTRIIVGTARCQACYERETIGCPRCGERNVPDAERCSWCERELPGKGERRTDEHSTGL